MRSIVSVSLLFLLFLPTALAVSAVPGSRIPLTLDNYEFKTTTLIVPINWKPVDVEWSLLSPTQEEVYFVDSPLDSVKVVKTGYEGANSYTIWGITEDSGYMEIPAFPQEGQWTLQAKFYNPSIPYVWSQTETIYQIPVVQGSLFQSLNAPIYHVFHFDFGFWHYKFPISINLTILFISILLFILLLIGIAIIKEVI